MPFCNNCGIEINTTDKYCKNCAVSMIPVTSRKHGFSSVLFTLLLTIGVAFESLYNYMEGLRGGFSIYIAILLTIGLIWLFVKPSKIAQVFLLVLATLTTFISILILIGYIFDVYASTTVKVITLMLSVFGTLSAVFISKAIKAKK